MNVVENILKSELNLPDELYNRFIGLTGTIHLKKKSSLSVRGKYVIVLA